MDRVFIQGLTVMTQIGVYDWEKSIQQKIIFDLEMTWDTTKAADTDDVAFALNYAEVSEFIIDFCQNNHFALIETLANQLASELIQHFSLPWLKLCVQKPCAVQAASSVGVIIERGEGI